MSSSGPLGQFEVLPKDVRVYLLRMLGPVDLSRLARTSSALRALCDDDSLWQRFCEARMVSVTCTTWKRTYIIRCGMFSRTIGTSEKGFFKRLFLKAKTVLFGQQAQRYLVLGLDSAGKTTFLYKLKLGDVMHTLPCIGFSVRSVSYKNIEISSWSTNINHIRILWRHYYVGVHGVIFVVDSTDVKRLDEACESLHLILKEDELRDAVLLVYANKQDKQDALSAVTLTQRLQLETIQNRIWNIFPMCAKNGDGILEGLEWLSAAVKYKSELQ